MDVSVGLQASCAVLNDGGLRCWGFNTNGRLGYTPEIDRIGDDEHPFEVGDVPAGGAVKQVAIGFAFMCLLYEAGNVRCIGDNNFGVLGYGHKRAVGLASEADDVPLGEPAVEIVAGAGYTCALLESGAVRCWGGGSPLGYGDDSVVGDDETPADKPALEIGGAVLHLSANTSQTCAVLAGGDGRARCWGNNDRGVLGLGHTNDIGDDETVAAGGDLPVGGAIEVIQAFNGATCAILTSGIGRCWGNGSTILGYANPEDLGDDELASAAPALRLGGRPRDLGGGGTKCAIMSDNALRCWGNNRNGALGYGNTNPVGLDGDIIGAGSVQLGGPVNRLARGAAIENHNCALLLNGEVRCWGINSSGELGLGHQENVGDDELPADVPAVRVLE